MNFTVISIAVFLASISLGVLAESQIELESEAGDYIGQGLSYLYDDDNAKISYKRNYDNGITVSISNLANEPYLSWTLNLAAPGDEEIKVGNYLLAERFPFQGADKPGLSFSGQGRGCNTVSGEFEVYQVSYDDDGDLTSLHAGFEQHCEGGDPSLKGIVSYNIAAESDSIGVNVNGMAPNKLICENKTSGQKITATVDGLSHDCKQYGLQVNPGDDIFIKVRGISN
ncbi:hypothetical protein [Microbulbifer sp. GL-2]|uniref:hypothetical protein n=1 Tax=Microbulbifer sp. GL-2 TaxID=2591606 RepID=UPI0011628AEA|nr:hypothetical protein [Microbulbifer sp. GL-2]BBM04124.1 hypothetical protein GL2_41980 [Microbulbifer sp. GL-2]